MISIAHTQNPVQYPSVLSFVVGPDQTTVKSKVMINIGLSQNSKPKSSLNKISVSLESPFELNHKNCYHFTMNE